MKKKIKFEEIITMKRNQIKLSEQELRDILKESIHKILSEDNSQKSDEQIIKANKMFKELKKVYRKYDVDYKDIEIMQHVVVSIINK